MRNNAKESDSGRIAHVILGMLLAACMTFLRGDDSLVPVFEGTVLYTSVLGNQDAGEAASLAYLSRTDAASAANAAGKVVGTKEICGQTLYYVAGTAE